MIIYMGTIAEEDLLQLSTHMQIIEDNKKVYGDLMLKVYRVVNYLGLGSDPEDGYIKLMWEVEK